MREDKGSLEERPGAQLFPSPVTVILEDPHRGKPLPLLYLREEQAMPWEAGRPAHPALMAFSLMPRRCPLRRRKAELFLSPIRR